MGFEVVTATFLPHIVVAVLAYFGLGILLLELPQLPRVLLALATPSILGLALLLTSRFAGTVSEFLLAPVYAIGF